MRAAIFGLCFMLFMSEVAGAADGGTAVANHWQALARIDVEGAYALLEHNHPGAVPKVSDSAFRAALVAAHTKALARAAKVTNYEGYVATMGEFAGSMGDSHIWTHSLFLARTIQWAGLIAAKRGSNWVVANEDPKIVGSELVGARIVSCDGLSAEALALDALHFRAVVSNDAEQVLRGGWLLVDEGNPFLQRPRSCIVEQEDKRISLTLNWNKIGRDNFLRQYWKSPFGEAGFGVRSIGAGFWIAIQHLTPQAQPVIDTVKAQVVEIRSAPYAVVDLRGNGGGNDSYGRALAEELYGQDYVESILGPKEDAGGCVSVFRASRGNMDALSDLAQQFQKSGDSVGAKEYTAALRLMKAAVATGHTLTGSLSCQTTASSAPRERTSLMRGKVFVLTDAACFSSCIQTVGYFRKLGGIQVGQATGADTHYSEVREIVLPSGLSTFSTLQAIMTDEPHNIGPYLPKYEFEGDIADTAALEKWIKGPPFDATSVPAGSEGSALLERQFLQNK